MQQVTANKPSKTKSPEALLLPGIQWWTIQDLNLEPDLIGCSPVLKNALIGINTYTKLDS